MEIRDKFINICSSILFSDDELAVARAYRKMFKDFRYYIIDFAPAIRVSCLEDVFEKIMKDAYVNEYSYSNEAYQMFVSLIKEQGKRRQDEQSSTDLSKFLMIYHYDGEADRKINSLT